MKTILTLHEQGTGLLCSCERSERTQVALTTLHIFDELDLWRDDS